MATQFGVARAQVERDHLISHLLGYRGAQFAFAGVLIGSLTAISALLYTVAALLTLASARILGRFGLFSSSKHRWHERIWSMYVSAKTSA